MTQKIFIVNGGSLSEHLKKPHIIKTYSFTTDDDDAGLIASNPSPTISNHDKLLSINSASIDNYTNDGDSSENSKKFKKRKSKQQTELENHIENKIPINIKHPWYKKTDFLRLLTVIIVIVVVYFIWIKRDIWINRLLTSNVRMRRYGIETGNSSVMDSSSQEDIIENIEEKKNDVNEELNSQKINLRVRKNKMNFNKEIPKKKLHHHHSPNSSNEDQSILSSTKKKHQHRSLITQQSTPIHISTYDDIIEQVRKNLKSRSRQREFFSKLSKVTGLKKDQLYRFIYKKDYHIITLETFVTTLDSFHLMLLIVRK